MSKNRLVSGRIKKATGTELSTDRYEYLDLANAEPDLGVPAVDESVLIGDINGTRTWVDIATYADQFKGFTGSQGDIGFTGSQGVIGFVGSQGNIGFTGSQGDIGFTGSQGDIGFTGSQGDIGFTGSQGNIGFTGSQGDIGFTGSQGDIGFTGSQGDIGFTGSQGDVGFTGSGGAGGATGSQGDIGFTGSQGDVGFTGSQGDTGFTGSVGFTGSQGVIGFTGSQGDIGFTGSQGDVGFTGSQGDIGFTGSQGDVGFTGSGGAGGATGSQGDIGFTGSQGDTGFTGSQGEGFTGSKGDIGLEPWKVINSDYTASNRDRLIANGTAGSFNITLPETPTAGDYIQITDGANFELYPITILRNGNTIEGFSENVLLDLKSSTFEFIYDGATWQLTSTTGPQGFTGSQGDIGVVGFTGSQGLPGEFAALGYTGSQGAGFTGSQGAVVAAISATPPVGPALGDVWIDSATGIQYFYVDDGDSAQWIEFSNPGTVVPSGSGGVELSASKIYGLSTVFSFGG